MEQITFKTLKKGKYRCNQTSELTRNPKAYKRALLRSLSSRVETGTDQSLPHPTTQPVILDEHALMFMEGAIS